MTSEPLAYVDGEDAARLWLKQLVGVSALVGNRVYFELPRAEAPTLPAVEIQTATQTPFGEGFVSVQLGIVTYGNTKHQASQVAMTIANYLENKHGFPVQVTGYTIVGGGDAFVTPIQGNEKIKRYSVTGFLEVRKN